MGTGRALDWDGPEPFGLSTMALGAGKLDPVIRKAKLKSRGDTAAARGRLLLYIQREPEIGRELVRQAIRKAAFGVAATGEAHPALPPDRPRAPFEAHQVDQMLDLLQQAASAAIGVTKATLRARGWRCGRTRRPGRSWQQPWPGWRSWPCRRARTMAADMKASVTLTLKDKVTPGLAALEKTLSGLHNLMRKLEQLSLLNRAVSGADVLTSKLGQVTGKLNQVGSAARSTRSALDRLSEPILVNMKGTAFLPPAMARTAMAATIAAAAAMAASSGGGVPRVPGMSAPFIGPSLPLMLAGPDGGGGGIPLNWSPGRFEGLRSAASGFRAELGRTASQARHVGAELRELGHAGLTAFATGFGLMHPIKEYAEYENTLRHIAITANVSKADIPRVTAELAKQYNMLALASGQGSEKIAEAANFLITTGIGRENVDKLLPLVARASTAYNTQIGDSVQAIFSLKENLHVPDAEMAGTISAAALAGKEGHFSFSDMSRYLPDIAPIAAPAGLKGAKGARELMAYLETSRRNAGTSSEANTNLRDFLSHLFGDSKRGLGHEFAKKGVNLEKLLLSAEKQGISAPEAVLEKVRSMTAGLSDYRKNLLVGSLFHNLQSKTFVLGALNDRKRKPTVLWAGGLTATACLARAGVR